MITFRHLVSELPPQVTVEYKALCGIRQDAHNNKYLWKAARSAGEVIHLFMWDSWRHEYHGCI